MATVTGFTAERMLEIENTTVVDGEVVGNDLHLLQRDGTPINAGNVRGPQGIQGVPGPVPSVNGQTGPVYAPRFFANKAALDTDWPSPPDGAHAYTIADQNSWVRVAGTWQAAPAYRVFATVAQRDAQWLTPPVGAICVTLENPNRMWLRESNGVWYPAGNTRFLIRNIKASQEGGFGGGTEYPVAGIDFLIPASPPTKTHKVEIVMRTVITTANASYNQIFICNLRQGSTNGPVTANAFAAFDNCMSTYGVDRIFQFMPLGLVNGTRYYVTINTDGVGRFNVLPSYTYSTVYDMS